MIILIAYFSREVYFNIHSKQVIAQVYKYGARGEQVKQIQTKLKKWGYYKESVDGIYGYNTYLSVKSFQKSNGLKVDGMAGNSTLSAIGLPSSTQASGSPSNKNVTNNKDVDLVAKLINGEARGEPYEGQVAVGATILNRTRDARFPSTIAAVIYQPGAFTAIVDGQINAKIEESSIRAARDALNGWDPSGGAVFYFNPATSTNKWIWSRTLIKVIGKHRFCS
ncbi:spore cortex-lytic enzyme [Clostridium estertheticum]|uniref:spore cortex-lytic enzyme n=1 Tax=Clostridium estertheticum TaxID=238834 RepID=UPI001C6DE050|nr:spore cortex-lytic enzyme [Clostridium estertheticum]MBW9150775.1 spore cortex-lytic enzyme [Clostridium estertheticum]WLC86067.1 spore cortex-lytic enzyme [Clostridium estertheticum]